ncbi:MAG: ComF family protein [Parcubacteria group bacterium]|nr:ComF family protein [Parcubacteria group bacterium]
MQEGISKIWQFLLDIIFPIKCVSCGREGEWVCTACLREIELNRELVCPRCGYASGDGSFCDQCRVTSKMAGIIVAASYEDKLLQQAVHALKYKFVREMSRPLATILSGGLKIWLNHHQGDRQDVVLVPVPLYRKRERQRGFNQTALLAQELNKMARFTVRDDVLVRIKSTPAQAKLDPIKRRKNIKGAFRLENTAILQGKTVFIIDDICTTSATLEECAKEIDKAQPREIWGLVLARGK